jgi:hypothetical protein
MNKKSIKASLAAIGLTLVVVVVAAASGVLTNGDFETGNLNGWDTEVTANGTSGGINVVHFQTTTTQVSGSQAARMTVGQIIFTPGVREGAGIFQSFSLASSGDVLVSADVAAQELTFIHGNGDGGIFDLMVDGVVVDSFDSETISPGAIERSHLSAEISLAAGLHEVRVEARREYSAGAVAQYIDNVDVTVLTVTKADVLGGSGVTGSGIGTAPGLQTEFNEKSGATQHAGKK